MRPAVLAADPGLAVEAQLAGDMARRALPAIPVVLLITGLIWGVDGAVSAGFAILLVLANLALSAAMLGRAARIGLALLMAAALGGFILRLVLLTAVVLAVKDQPWVELVPFGITLVVTHLGLLIWETKHVSASLAFPALKPPRPEVAGPKLTGGRR